MRKKSRAIIIGVVALTMSLAACSTKAASSGSSSSGGVKTDNGVTDKTITLGVQTDESAVFKEIGLGLTRGNQMWADDVNASGGICGRQIKIDVRDNGYDAAKAVTLYAAMKDNVAAMIQLLGSPIMAALKSQLASDNMLAIPASQAATNLDLPTAMMVGTTYDVEMINGLSYLKKIGKIKDGDKLGHIYIEGEYGQSGLNGSEAYAKKNNMTVIGIKVGPTDADMSAAVTKLKSEGVNAVLLTTTGAQLGSTATQMAAQGMGALPIMGNNPTYATTLVKSPAMSALGNYYRSISILPYGADNPEAQKLVKEFDKKYPGQEPNDDINAGYTYGLTMQTVLEKACKDKDLTRAGIVKASKGVKVDTKGLAGSEPLDFSHPGKASTISDVIEQIDPSVVGYLKVIQPFASSDEAKVYKSPLNK
ncbi:ABC-type branched-subunit amino acid transport system substrate-binding protein [Antricoccus suffuscus]|uniref:ABC-type branched-subunit amino acid transport system substrate-binding protein n=1 Tax=Antricoccus suffuscus TaxID=1629062 RepID=A0A2T0ZKG1_9ACTN|nr:ABC transporter substrate-binding protein [Antricoccus suffuscus]PRZ36628.1 ABC-type branched-subunit amino acid transport system substrate-binding protein [Antricoccus suffuscus]